MEADGDLLTAMARELVTRQGVGEQADAVWKALQMKRGDHVTPAQPNVAEAGSYTDEADEASHRARDVDRYAETDGADVVVLTLRGVLCF